MQNELKARKVQELLRKAVGCIAYSYWLLDIGIWSLVIQNPLVPVFRLFLYLLKIDLLKLRKLHFKILLLKSVISDIIESLWKIYHFFMISGKKRR